MGSSGGSASREAQQAEERRLAQIQETQSRIEGIFSDPKREAQIEDYINATRGVLQGDLNRTKSDNDRQLKFSLARSGLHGGSTGIDQNRNLSEAFLRATVDAERKSQGAGARLRDADQQAKLSLFNQALGGLDMTTAANNAGQAMRNNIGMAQQTQTETNFDDFFSDFANIYSNSRKAAGERRTQREFGTDYGSSPIRTLNVAGSSPFANPPY